MLPIDPLSTGLGLLTAIPNLVAAVKQKRLANRLKLQDTTPGAFREQLAGLRLDAGTARLPGQSAAENKLAQNFAAGAAATTRAGGSSADALAGISALSLQRQQGQAALTTQGLQYRDLSKQRLNGGLQQLAGYQMRDQDDYSRNKANLINSSNQNLNNAVNGLAGIAALGINSAKRAEVDKYNNRTSEVYAIDPKPLLGEKARLPPTKLPYYGRPEEVDPLAPKSLLPGLSSLPTLLPMYGTPRRR